MNTFEIFFVRYMVSPILPYAFGKIAAGKTFKQYCQLEFVEAILKLEPIEIFSQSVETVLRFLLHFKVNFTIFS